MIQFHNSLLPRVKSTRLVSYYDYLIQLMILLLFFSFWRTALSNTAEQASCWCIKTSTRLEAPLDKVLSDKMTLLLNEVDRSCERKVISLSDTHFLKCWFSITRRIQLCTQKGESDYCKMTLDRYNDDLLWHYFFLYGCDAYSFKTILYLWARDPADEIGKMNRRSIVVAKKEEGRNKQTLALVINKDLSTTSEGEIICAVASGEAQRRSIYLLKIGLDRVMRVFLYHRRDSFGMRKKRALVYTESNPGSDRMENGLQHKKKKKGTTTRDGKWDLLLFTSLPLPRGA